MDELPGHDTGLEYHARLLGDPHRVTAYERALREVVTPESVVLDVGAGTGLLAVLAARCGARRVYAVESMPIADLASALAIANGVGDRVTVHRGDIRTMEPLGKVDLVVSDFMGRWVLDDQMIGAMDAAVTRWLVPGGRVVPQRVQMHVAPVEVHWFEPLDAFRTPLLGVDLSPLRRRAHEHCYGAMLSPHAQLGPARLFATLDPLRLREARFDRTLAWEVLRAGTLRGLAGWFDATLTDEVALSTVPGVQTHWAQYLFPTPPLEVRAGDGVQARVWLEDDQQWRWSGAVTRQGEILLTFDHRQRVGRDFATAAPGAVVEAPSLDVAQRLNEQGAARYEAGDLRGAAQAFGAATQALPADADPILAAELYENYGLTCVLSGRAQDAVPAFLRALDGDFASREQSARFLVNACFAAGRHMDGARYLEAYEMVFGPHPSQWRRVGEEET